MDALLKGKSHLLMVTVSSLEISHLLKMLFRPTSEECSQVPGASGRVYNIAFGERTTINELYFNLKDIVGSDIGPTYREPRKGDVRDSLADISKAKAYLDYDPKVSIKDGLDITIKWFAKNYGEGVTQ